LIVLTPEKRLGALNIKDLMRDEFFKEIDFDKINEESPP